jgi:RNA polymerase primary sigma factor
MYMREMGAVSLLTREGEIEIAKRIEGGLKDMVQAISACPTTISEIIALSHKIASDELKIDEVVDGFVDHERQRAGRRRAGRARRTTRTTRREEVEEEDGDANGGAAGFSTEQLAQLKKAARWKSSPSSKSSSTRWATPSSPRLRLEGLRKGAGSHLDRAAGHPLHRQGRRKAVRHAARPDGRSAPIERAVLDICVNRCGMPRAHFIKVFPGNETDLEWVRPRSRLRLSVQRRAGP